MGDGFSINISGQDLKRISDRYSQLKFKCEKSKVDENLFDYLCKYFLLVGFEECLEYVGIDHKIFENGIEPLE